ncbi:MAG: ATP-binding protein [Pseudomonadota bacterium]
MTTSFIPILAVDVLGSVVMVVISILALNTARILRIHDRDNAVFLYLLWIAAGFCIFSVSRSFGHILRQFLTLSSYQDIWESISPYSGTINTVSFMLVGLITLFFGQSWNINEKILTAKKRLEETHTELLHLNQNLELKVVERTEMLTTSEHKCRRIFEQSLDTILVTDNSWKLLEINPAGIAMTGYPRKDMIHGPMHMDRLFASQSEWERIRDAIVANEFILNEETDFVRPDGSLIRVLITGAVDYGAFGCGKTHHFIIKNINDKKLMEKQMAQAEKLAALGELSAGVAHEINNPLGIILGYTQLMLKRTTDPESIDFDDLKTIEKHVNACRAVVSDLLKFSHKVSAEQTRVSVNSLVRDVVKFLSNHPALRQIEIDLSLSREKPSVMGTEQELRQVMINLLINAGHAVNKDGEIRITTTRKSDGHVHIAVMDNGSGIDPETMPRIFDPFFTTKPVGEGTGLGLSVSYGIIKNHKGDIRVQSRPGEWTVFTVILPSAPEHEERS